MEIKQKDFNAAKNNSNWHYGIEMLSIDLILILRIHKLSYMPDETKSRYIIRSHLKEYRGLT